MTVLVISTYLVYCPLSVNYVVPHVHEHEHASHPSVVVPF